MKLFDTANLDERTRLSSDERSWIYNGLDCCVTLEVFTELDAQLQDEPENVKSTYADALAKQAPVMEMSMRGIKIDERQRQQSIRELERDLHRLEATFDRLTSEVFDFSMNWRSPIQVKTLLYDILRLPPVKKRNARGVFAPTTGRAALEKLQSYHYGRIYISHILAMRDIGKMLGTLRTQIDPDGRIRTSFNVAGTNTGRLASSASDFGTGTNLQNIDGRLRKTFVADPGYILINIDLEQADARNVGAVIWNLFVDSEGPEKAGAYLDACESGDLHTQVAQMVWPELEWPGDPKGNRTIADQPHYREMSYRDLAKRLGHGTNYFGTPRTMAHHTKTDISIIKEFQRRYFAAFPLIGNLDHELSDPPKDWHSHVFWQVKNLGHLTTQFGRRRYFFGRYKAPETLREAIAYEPQSMTAHEIDMGYLNVWRTMPEVQLLLQVHDSIMLQVPFEALSELYPKILETMRVELELKQGRKFSVPLEGAVGWNWGYPEYDKQGKIKSNPYGLMKWKGEEQRSAPVTRGNRLTQYL